MSALPLEKQVEEVPVKKALAVSCEDVHLAYSDGTAALRGITLEFPTQQHHVIMGPSGSGKSSLLGCIAGRLKPSSGLLKRNGRVATIHQDLRLVAEKTAIENVLHGSFCRHPLRRTLFGFPKVERDRSVQLLCRVGLCEKLYIPVKRLSGGERQRVAIARALMQDPQILLADEPVASLDEENAHEIMGLVTELAQERKLTVISVLHDFHLARQFADRIVRLVNGRIVYERDANSMQYAQHPSLPIIDKPGPQLSAQKPMPTADQLPSKPVDWKMLPIAIVAVLLWAWSVSGLHLHFREMSEMLSGISTFVAQLIPTTQVEFAKIQWGTLFAALIETLQMAVVGTTVGIIFAWPLSAVAAGNVGPKRFRMPVRFFLNTIRTVPSLIWALLFVAAVGLGTFAGILALTAYSVGYLSKFFYEAFETVDPGPPDALKEIGASGLQRFFHAVWPAATPAVLSSAMFMLEYNVRAASILGVVDAGGIGFYMKQYIDFRAFPSLFACLLLILVVVVAFDAISCRVRNRLLKTD